MRELHALNQSATAYAKDVRKFDRDNVRKMGLVDTGKGVRTMKYKISFDGRTLTIDFLAEDYLAKFNKKTSPNKIKFEYSRLVEWAKRKKPGSSKKEIDRFLYLTIRKWREEGMPTQASRRFSQTGKRTGWVDSGTDYANLIFDASFGLDEFLNDLLDDGLEPLVV